MYGADHGAETRVRLLSLWYSAGGTARSAARRIQKALESRKPLRSKKASECPGPGANETAHPGASYKRSWGGGDRSSWHSCSVRDGQTSACTLRDAISGAVITASRVQAACRDALALIPLGQAGAVRFWALVVCAGVGLLWVAWRASARLRSVINACLATGSTPEAFGTRSGVAALLILQSAIWPAYIMLVAWAGPRIIVAEQPALNQVLPLVASVHWSALVLWGWLLARAFLRPQGWMQYYWGLSPEVGRHYNGRHCGVSGDVGLSGPRYTLLNAPGGPEAVAGSLALARLCFTAFQVVLLGLVLIMGRRGSGLMTAVLARSREAQGFVWRYWPLVYLILLAGVSTALGLDLLGYHYASQELWLKSGEALLIILALVWVDHAINTLIDRLLARQQPVPASASAPPPSSLWTLLHRARPFARVAMLLLALLVLEHIYGISEGLLGALDRVHVLELGRNGEGVCG